MFNRESAWIAVLIFAAWIAVLMVAPIILVGLSVWWNFVFQTARSMGL